MAHPQNRVMGIWITGGGVKCGGALGKPVSENNRAMFDVAIEWQYENVGTEVWTGIITVCEKWISYNQYCMEFGWEFWAAIAWRYNNTLSS